MSKNNIKDGFQIDEPAVFVHWDSDEKELVALLGKYGLRKITKGYYCISCKSIGGLQRELGFHFDIKEDENKIRELEDYGKIIKTIRPDLNSRREGKIKELEFFRKEPQDLKKSFDEFQFYFEKEFGKPTLRKVGNAGFMNYEWKLEGVKIYHYVIDRFGPEEHMRIIKA